MHQVESQYQYRDQRFNLVAGGGFYQTDANVNTIIRQDVTDGSLEIFRFYDDNQREKINGYLYTNYNLRSNLNITVGSSYDSHQNPVGSQARPIDYGRFNPKLGLQWNIVSNVRFRLAWFETTKSALVANQTIEPTQIAGFNQMYDDINGTKSRRMGLGIDTHYANIVFGGIEISQRDLDVLVQI